MPDICDQDCACSKPNPNPKWASMLHAVPTMRVRLAQIAGERQPAVGTGGEPPRDRNRMRCFFRVSAAGPHRATRCYPGGAELPSAVPTMRVRLAQIAGERQPAVGTGGEPPRDRNRMRYFFRVFAVSSSLSKNSTK